MEREFLVGNTVGLKVTVKGGRRPRLEVRSSDDFGWYDGSVALVHEDDDGEGDPEKLQVRVHFTGFEETYDEIWGLEVLGSEREIRNRVRLLSHQLQDKECRKVFPGMVVCANYKSSDGVECKYFDAIVTAVSRGAHERKNREEICHCCFTVHWEEGPLKGTFATLNCPDITLIVARDVGYHPVVRALLDFAKDFSVVAPIVSQLGKHEGNCSPRYEVSPHSPPNPECDASWEDTEVQEREGFKKHIPEIEEVQMLDGVGKKNHNELNLEHDMREEKVETVVVQKREVFRIEKLFVNELQVGEFFTEQAFESMDLQGQRVCTEKPGIEEARASEIVGIEFEKEEKQEREDLDGASEIVGIEFEEEEKQGSDEPDEEMLGQQKKPMTDAIEIDWDEELQIEKLMDELGSHYRVCEDEILDLPRDVADHLRNFQKVQDCLEKETVELEKFLL